MGKETDQIKLLRAGVRRLSDRISDLESLDFNLVRGYVPDIRPIEQIIEETLASAFAHSGKQLNRYKDASRLVQAGWIVKGEPALLRSHLKKKGVPRSVALLRQAVRDLETEIVATEIASPSPSATRPIVAQIVSKIPRSIFVVHGHDDEARQAISSFLGRLGFDVIILHEQPTQGRTIIEQIEQHSDVGFAVVLLTADDIGGQSSATLNGRARQNVVLELGYFIGRLGRERVCALKIGDIDLPSDILGVLWVPMSNSTTDWQQRLAHELEAAGYQIDWRNIALGRSSSRP